MKPAAPRAFSPAPEAAPLRRPPGDGKGREPHPEEVAVIRKASLPSLSLAPAAFAGLLVASALGSIGCDKFAADNPPPNYPQQGDPNFQQPGAPPGYPNGPAQPAQPGSPPPNGDQPMPNYPQQPAGPGPAQPSPFPNAPMSPGGLPPIPGLPGIPGQAPPPASPAPSPNNPPPVQPPAPSAPGGFPFPFPLPMPGGGGGAPGPQAPSAGPATPVDPGLANAATVPLMAFSQQEAAGMSREGSVVAAKFSEGQTLEQTFQMLPGKCYTVLAVGAGVSQIDLSIVALTPVPMLSGPIAQHSGGQSAALGGRGNCVRWSAPFGINAKYIVRAAHGQGLAAAQLYSK